MSSIWRLAALMTAILVMQPLAWAYQDHDFDRGDVPSFELVVDTDVARTTPVPHRFIHGTFDDAKFQVCLPAEWNGKLVIMAKPITGNELWYDTNSKLKDLILQKNYAYAQSDEGWLLDTIASQPEDSFLESRVRLLQLRVLADQLIADTYGVEASRVYLMGLSNGGYHVKGLLEDFPEFFDGGFEYSGYNSLWELFGMAANFVRNVDIVTPRMTDIIAKRLASPNWNHITEPLSPPLTEMQIAALTSIYTRTAELRNQFEYSVGAGKGSERTWVAIRAALFRNLQRGLSRVDALYDPNEDGVLSDPEILAWKSEERPRRAQMRVGRRQDLSGDLGKPLIIVHGSIDPVVSLGETLGYKELAEKVLGPELAAQLLRVYVINGVGHNPIILQDAFTNAAIDALDGWVVAGTLPADLPNSVLQPPGAR